MLIQKIRITASLAVVLLVLSACGGGGTPEDTGSEVLTQAAEIASQGLTQTAAAASPTDEPLPSPTVTFLPTNTAQQTLDALPTNALGGTLTAEALAGGSGDATPTTGAGQPANPPATPTPFPTPTTGSGGQSGAPCHRANLEWENIPDGTDIQIGKNFEKAWRLKNIGTCTWTAGYSLIFVQGELFNAASVVELPGDAVPVPPNGYVTVRVPMRAPNDSGTYQGYWMIRSPEGNVFGVGLQGTEWFWVLVDVYNPDA